MNLHCTVSSFVRGLPLWWEQDALPWAKDFGEFMVSALGAMVVLGMLIEAIYVLGRAIMAALGALPWHPDPNNRQIIFSAEDLATESWWFFAAQSEHVMFAVFHALWFMMAAGLVAAVVHRSCKLGQNGDSSDAARHSN